MPYFAAGLHIVSLLAIKAISNPVKDETFSGMKMRSVVLPHGICMP